MSAPRRCESCDAPLADDQRYCLACGARAGAPDAQLTELLGRVSDASKQAPEAAAQTPTAPPPAAEPILRLPSPLISALLVATFVGFGALLGNAGAGAGRPTEASPALKLIVPHHAAASATGAASPSSGGSEPSSPAPESSPESTPAAEPAPASKPSTAASSTKQKEAQAGEKETEASKETASGSGSSAAAKLSDIKHVFLIVLGDQAYAEDFGPESPDHYLAHTLEAKGELLLRYDAIAHEQLPNGIALLSGQGPTAQTAADCPTYSTLAPATAGADEQVLGEGCAYPASVATIAGQLAAKHLGWRAYVQGMDEAGGVPGACAHPSPGEADASFASGPYATYRNPFVYFGSITQSPSCQGDDVGLDRLKADLSGSEKSTPSLSYIVPDRCQDADSTPCAPGAVAGAGDAAGFLEAVVPEILASKAYKKDGLLVITAAEAPSSGELGDSSSCCGQPAYPNYTASGLRHGGGTVGALLLSPLVKGATTAQEPYNHFSLLRTIEDVFGLRHLGYAALPAVKSLSTSLLNGTAKG
ncbi:MAG: alkaline phosphatase family protein [Solirubrobacteraceae bacterium]